jgi:hypothetical protein
MHQLKSFRKEEGKRMLTANQVRVSERPRSAAVVTGCMLLLQ